MYFLIYRSEAVKEMSEDDLRILLAQSREHNRRIGITGMLLFFGNKFLQLLEGDREEVTRLYAAISTDRRHKRVITLKEGDATKRIFPNWSMSFRHVSNAEILNEPAYKDIYMPGSPGAIDLVSLFNLLRGKFDNLDT